MFVPSLVMTTDLVTPSIKATAIGGFNAAGSLGFMIGPITGGWVTEVVGARHGMHAGYRAAFVTAGVAELACVLVTLPFLVRLVRSGRTT
jgi:MFS family permease